MFGVDLAKMQAKWAKKTLRLRDTVQAITARYKKRVVYQWINLPKPEARAKRLAVLVHFDPSGCVHDYVFYYVKSLRAANCDVIFVSSAPTLRADDIATLKTQCVAILHRKNIGYDFGSWRDAVACYPQMKDDYQSIIFANDSVYGPLYDLAPILDDMDARDLDLWSMTSSAERCYHLQSYFWVLNKRALIDGFFDYFWSSYYRFYSLRRRVIDRYELRLAELAKNDFSLRVGAFCEFDTAVKRKESSSCSQRVVIAVRSDECCNPMQYFWYELIVGMHCPFFKRELLKSNSHEFDNYQKLSEVICSIAPIHWKLAKSHVQNFL